MNANKQDAGGLPPLPESLNSVYIIPHDGGVSVENPFSDYYSVDQMRAYGEQCRAASGDGELRETAEQNWLFIEHITNWIIGRGLLEVTHEGGSLEAAKNITDSLDRALSRGVPEGK